VPSEVAHRIKDEEKNWKNFGCFFDDPDDKVPGGTARSSNRMFAVLS